MQLKRAFLVSNPGFNLRGMPSATYADLFGMTTYIQIGALKYGQSNAEYFKTRVLNENIDYYLLRLNGFLINFQDYQLFAYI